MIIFIKILLFLSVLTSTKRIQSLEITKLRVRTVFTPPLCYAKVQSHKKHAGILDSSTVTILMALLAMSTVLTL
jgi:hypothetical protein